MSTSSTRSDGLAPLVDSLFSAWDRADSPGAAVAIVQGGNMVHARGYGLANLQYDIPFAPDTITNVGSIAKQFTAMVMATLACEGELSLDDDIRTHLPYVADFGACITYRQIMHHTSGLRSTMDVLLLAGWRAEDLITQDDAITMASHQQTLNFPPGTAFEYSNTGYNLLAEVIEAVTGLGVGDYLQQHVFAPLGMADSVIYDDHRMIVKNKAYPYRRGRDGRFAQIVENATWVGASGLLTSASDLAKWLSNYDRRIVGTPEVFDLMHQRGALADGTRTDYGLALEIETYRGLQWIGHGGNWRGYGNYMVRLPEEGLGIIVLANIQEVAPKMMVKKIVDAMVFKGPDPRAANLGEAAATDAFDRRRGLYRLESGGIIKLYYDTNRPCALLLNRPKIELSPKTETVLYDDEQGVEIEFLGDGRAGGLLLRDGGRTTAAAAVGDLALERDRIDEIVGAYYSEEVAATVQVEESKGRGDMVIKRRWSKDLVMHHIDGDWFIAELFESVLFRRDGAGAVAGFAVNRRRIRDFYFTKVS